MLHRGGNPVKLQDNVHLNAEFSEIHVGPNECAVLFVCLGLTGAALLHGKIIIILPGHSCPGREKTAPSEKSCWPTCSRGSTCPDCSRTSEKRKDRLQPGDRDRMETQTRTFVPDNPPAAQGP